MVRSSARKADRVGTGKSKNLVCCLGRWTNSMITALMVPPQKLFQLDKKKSRHDRAARWVISGANPISLEETAAGAFAHAGKVS